MILMQFPICDICTLLYFCSFESACVCIIFTCCRIVHKLGEKFEAYKVKSSQISSALECVSIASDRVEALQDKITKEQVIYTEKKEACSKLLIQIGQDTAILKQHSQLLSKQGGRVTHLKKVSRFSFNMLYSRVCLETCRLKSALMSFYSFGN